MGVNNNISQSDQERFENYLLGLMDASQKNAFENDLDNDANLKKSFEEFKDLFRTIEEAGLRSKLNDYHDEIQGSNPKTISLNILKNKQYYYVAASLIFLFFVAGYQFLNNKNTYTNIYENYYTVDPGLPTVMGHTNAYDFYKTMVAYKQGNYGLAIKQWEKLLINKPDNDTLNYFLGSAHLAKDDVKKAIPYLEKVTENKQSFFYDDSQFYLGLIYLREGKPEKAKLHLELSKKDKCAQILRQLEKK